MPTPDLSFSHLGIFVHDLERMSDFYSRLLGFTISDRGELDTPRGKVSLVFLTRDPREHHQIVLASGDRKSTRLNSSHSQTSYAVFCLKKKTRSSAAAPSG